MFMHISRFTVYTIALFVHCGIIVYIVALQHYFFEFMHIERSATVTRAGASIRKFRQLGESGVLKCETLQNVSFG